MPISRVIENLICVWFSIIVIHDYRLFVLIEIWILITIPLQKEVYPGKKARIYTYIILIKSNINILSSFLVDTMNIDIHEFLNVANVGIIVSCYSWIV